MRREPTKTQEAPGSPCVGQTSPVCVGCRESCGVRTPPTTLTIFFNVSLLLTPHTGYNCIVYDYGSRNKKRGVPRALWYGLEFVRFALNWVWFGDSTKAGTSIA